MNGVSSKVGWLVAPLARKGLRRREEKMRYGLITTGEEANPITFEKRESRRCSLLLVCLDVLPNFCVTYSFGRGLVGWRRVFGDEEIVFTGGLVGFQYGRSVLPRVHGVGVGGGVNVFDTRN